MSKQRTRLSILGLLGLTIGLGCALPSASAANAPKTFAPFRGAGPGYTYAFAKPVRSTRPGVVQFQFPGTLHVSSVHPPLYSLVSVFVLYVSTRSPWPSVAEQAGDTTRECLGRAFASDPVPKGTTGFAFECRPNLSEWMCTSDVGRGNVRVAISVTTPKKGQCLPYQALLERAFFRKAGVTVS